MLFFPHSALRISKGCQMKDRHQNFFCQMCGNCCAIDGIVKIAPPDVERISAFLGIGPAEFADAYLRRMPGEGWVLKDQPGTTNCIFLTEDRLCRVHEVKPAQCAEFPSKWTSADALDYCEGLKLEARNQSIANCE